VDRQPGRAEGKGGEDQWLDIEGACNAKGPRWQRRPVAD